MAGKLYDGRNEVSDAKNGVPKNSQAYCDGIVYRSGGTALQRPKTDNPNQPGSEQATAWDAGWDLADFNAGSQIPKGSGGPCAVEGITIPA